MGKHCGQVSPSWLAPDQVVVLPISEKYMDYAYHVAKRTHRAGNPRQVDDRGETIGKKIRENELMKIPYLLIVGEKEEADGTVSGRLQGQGDQGTEKIGTFAEQILQKVDAEMNAWRYKQDAKEAQ